MATPVAEPGTESDWRSEFLRKLNNRPETKGAKLRTTGLLVTVKGSSLAPIEAACASQSYNRCLTARYALTGKPAMGTLFHGFAEDLARLTSGIVPRAKLTARDERAWAEYARRAHPRVGELPHDPDSVRDLLLQVSGDPKDDSAPLRVGERLVLLAELAEEAVDLDEWRQVRDALFSKLPERVVVVVADPQGRLRPPDGVDDRVLVIELPAPEPSPRQGKQARYRPGALAPDVPAAHDALGLNRHFSALARLLLHHETGRLTLAVEGAWGMGKSSFMQFLENTMVEAVLARHVSPRYIRRAGRRVGRAQDDYDELMRARDASPLEELQFRHLAPSEARRAYARNFEATRRVERAAARLARAEEALRGAQRRTVRDDLVVLHFNPWGYLQTGEIWAGLAHRLTSELRDTLRWYQRVALRIRYAREQKSAELWTAIATVLVAAVLTGVAAGEGVKFASSGTGGILYTGSLVLLAFIFLRAARGTKPVVDWLSSRFRPPDHAAGMGYQHEVIRDLRFYADGVRRGREECRMIVFIDDLDRCSDEQILEFMGAINLVLVSSGFYVVLGVDTRMIRDAIRKRFEGKEFEPEPGKDIADVYMEKIVQIAYRVPVADAARRYGSVSDLFSLSARSELEARRAPGPVLPGYTSDWVLKVDLNKLATPGEPVMPIAEQPVEDTADELQAFLDLQSLLPSNPRELKRMVNVHRLAKMLLEAEQMAWPPEQQRLLVVWLVISFRWPAAVRALARSPAQRTYERRRRTRRGEGADAGG